MSPPVTPHSITLYAGTTPASITLSLLLLATLAFTTSLLAGVTTLFWTEFGTPYQNNSIIPLIATLGIFLLNIKALYAIRKRKKYKILFNDKNVRLINKQHGRLPKYVTLKYKSILSIDFEESIMVSEAGRYKRYTIKLTTSLKRDNREISIPDELFKSLKDFEYCIKMLIHKSTGEDYDKIQAPQSDYFVLAPLKRKIKEKLAPLPEDYSDIKATQKEDSVIKR